MDYVCIDGVDDATLEFLGYESVAENGDFVVYKHHYTGTEQIVAKRSKRYLYVEDRNDAVWLNASRVIQVPRMPPKRT